MDPTKGPSSFVRISEKVNRDPGSVAVIRQTFEEESTMNRTWKVQTHREQKKKK
jgi:hypothetical protein